MTHDIIDLLHSTQCSLVVSNGGRVATFYKKGTCHIEFTNADVLKSFNIFASQKKGWLPPSYGKKTYHDMSTADRAVVDSFEGETSYNDTLARHLVPTTATLMQLAAHNPA